MRSAPEPFLQAIAPYREDFVVCVECLFTWYWLADLCAREDVPFVIGHALDRQAIHGGKATHDTSAAHKSAVLLRGGLLPQASGNPAAMRAPRHLLRRRTPLMRQRAALVAHVHQTNRQDHRPEMGKHIADKANRAGAAERLAAPAGHKRREVDWALLTSDDPRRSDLELATVNHAKHHAATPVYRLRSGPGVGKIVALVRRSDLHDRHRLPRGQDVVSSCRLVKWAKASAGNRSGTSGKNIGHADLTGACSEAAVLFLRHQPAGPPCRAHIEPRHGTGTAVTVLAHQLARAVDDLLKRHTVLAMETCLQR